MSGKKTRPCSAIPLSPTAHAPPGKKATRNKAPTTGSAGLLSVLQTAPFHRATMILSWTVQPTARALLEDRAAMPPKLPGTDGKSHPVRCPPAPAAGALATCIVAQASTEAAGGEAWDEVHAGVTAATARTPAKRRRLGMGFTCPPVREPCHPYDARPASQVYAVPEPAVTEFSALP